MALLGPPGCGKGTQGAVLKLKLQLAHISTGDLLREAVDHGTRVGLEAGKLMAEGKLVPDDLVLDLVRKRVEKEGAGYVLDGFPRTLAQATGLDLITDDIGQGLDHVVSLSVPREEVARRLGGRKCCPDCGRLYHQTFSPPREPERCDDCGSGLVIRDDDREETVLERIRVYECQSAPLLGFYEEKGLLRDVDGSGAPEEVTARLLSAVGHER
ncbi:MAG: adenylate kinase [Candidatus Binatia bacterium]